MVEGVEGVGLGALVVPVIDGFVSIHSAGTELGKFKYVLISRRGWMRTGARFVFFYSFIDLIFLSFFSASPLCLFLSFSLDIWQEALIVLEMSPIL